MVKPEVVSRGLAQGTRKGRAGIAGNPLQACAPARGIKVNHWKNFEYDLLECHGRCIVPRAVHRTPCHNTLIGKARIILKAGPAENRETRQNQLTENLQLI
jgi:hypothetical protein